MTCDECGIELPLPTQVGLCTVCLYDIAGRITRAVEGTIPEVLGKRQNTEDGE